MQYNLNNNYKEALKHNLSSRLIDIMSLYTFIHAGKHGGIKADKDGWFWISNDKLGEELPCIFRNDDGTLKHRNTILYCLKQLETKNIVETKILYNKKGKAMRYTKLKEAGILFLPQQYQ